MDPLGHDVDAALSDAWPAQARVDEDDPQRAAALHTWFDGLAQCGVVVDDWYCVGCGYNLRSQAVRRDDRTAVPLVRCPDCGRHAAANTLHGGISRFWRRTLALESVVWMVGVTALVAGLITAAGGLQAALVQIFVDWDWMGGSGRHVRNEFDGQWIPATILCTLMVICSLAWTVLLSVIAPHWKRGVLLLLAWMVVLGQVWVTAWYWIEEAPYLAWWWSRFALLGLVLLGTGASVGALCGRAVARAWVRLMLPPAARPVVVALWLMDGLPAPRGRGFVREG